jgi:hypothetical protein
MIQSRQSRKSYKGEFYFPLAEEGEGYSTNKKLDSFQNRWYSKHLHSMNEPILRNRTDSISIFRYTNLGTWNAPYTYRVEKSNNLVTITYRKTDGQGGYDTGDLVKDKTKTVALHNWDSLQTKIQAIDFWNSQTHDENIGLDGSEWILEGYSNGEYHFMTRWSPDGYGDPKFVEACNYFGEIFK